MACMACAGHLPAFHTCEAKMGLYLATAPMKGDPRFHALLTQIGELHDQKQADYGKDTDAFANVRASEEWGVSPWIGALIRATDKVRRLQTAATRGSLANEGVEDSLMDLAVYALISLVLFQEEQHEDV